MDEVTDYMNEVLKYLTANFWEPNLSEDEIGEAIALKVTEGIMRNIAPEMTAEFIALKLNAVRKDTVN